MSVNSRGYEDCLVDRRKEYSHFVWVSRKISPQIAFKQATRPLPASHKEAVLNSPKIQELLETLSQEQNVPKKQLEEQVKHILEEIGYNKNLKIIRWLGLVLVKICLRVCSGVFVNTSSVLQVKSEMGHCPVVFVPSHRSYADFILMSYVCFTYDIEIPAIAAGMDFHGMWGMGTMLRDTGAFFMRRSYNNDSLYWSTFKQYIHQLVTKGDLPIEFFIEGTRSRTNKSIAPKYGLIAMILKAFFFAEVPDILFVPINISYDRILEENLFAFELLGIPKPKESTKGFFKSLKIIKEKFGNIYYHFDKPISAKAFFANKLDRSVHSKRPLHQQEITEEEKRLLPPFAYEIMRKQQKATVLTVFNLLSVVLNNNMTFGDNLLTLSELTKEISWLKSVMESMGAYVHSENLELSIEECFEVHNNLVEVTQDGRVDLIRNKIILDKSSPLKLKAHGLSENTLTNSVPFVMLQIYVNPALYYLIDAALVVIILKCRCEMEKGELFVQYHFLRSLFSLEFVTFGSWAQTEFESALEQLKGNNLIHIVYEKYRILENRQMENVLFSSIQPFILSYFVMCLVLQNVPLVCDEKTILANVQKVLEDAITNEKTFVHPYCLTLDTLSNCLNSLCLMKVIKKSRRDNKVNYEVNRDEVIKIKERLEMYIPSFYLMKSFHMQLQLQNKL